MRIVVGLQRLPVFERHVERFAFWRARAALHVLEGLLVGRDQAGAGAAFDGHVTDRHAAFHRQRADRFAGELDDVAGAAGSADLADDGEDDVLGGDAGRQLAVDTHQHVLGLLLDQRLRREHMLDFGRADAVRQRAEGTMGRGVAVAAHDRHARQRKPLLRPDNVDDPLPLIEGVVIFDAEIPGVLGERRDLDGALGIGIGQRAVGGGDVVIDHGQRALGRPDLALVHAQALEGLRAGHFVDEVAVDINERRAVRVVRDQVVIPDFVVQRAAHLAESPNLLGV